MKINVVIFFYVTLTLYSCVYEIESSNLIVQPSILSACFADSIQKIYISHDYKDEIIENDWQMSFVSKQGKVNLNFIKDVEYYYDKSYKKILEYFNYSYYNEKLAIYSTNEKLLVDIGDSIKFEVNHNGVTTSANSVITPKVTIFSANVYKEEVLIKVNFPMGDYIWDISGEDIESNFSFRYINHVELNYNKDTLILINKDDKHTVKFNNRYFDSQKYLKIKYSSSTYPEHFFVYIVQRDKANTKSNSYNLFELFGDDISRFASIESNLKPFYGHFVIINRFEWAQQ